MPQWECLLGQGPVAVVVNHVVKVTAVVLDTQRLQFTLAEEEIALWLTLVPGKRSSGTLNIFFRLINVNNLLNLALTNFLYLGSVGPTKL